MLPKKELRSKNLEGNAKIHSNLFFNLFVLLKIKYLNKFQPITILQSRIQKI
jgi:hypothetical protein